MPWGAGRAGQQVHTVARPSTPSSLRTLQHPKTRPAPTGHHSPLPLLPSQQPLIRVLFRTGPLWAFHVDGIAQCLPFCFCLLSRRTGLPTFAHAAACVSAPSTFYRWVKSLVYFKLDYFLLLNYENSVCILDKCPIPGVGNSNRAGMAAWRNSLVPEPITGMPLENQKNNSSNFRWRKGLSSYTFIFSKSYLEALRDTFKI